MSHYKPYPAYKHSGVEWLPYVPQHWRVSAVKWEFEARLGKMLQPKPNDPTDFEVPYHKAVSVQWEQIALEAPESMWASPKDVETYQVRRGDLLICEGGDVGRAAIFERNIAEPLIIQNSLHRVRPKNRNLNEVLLRIMQAVRAAGWFDVLCSKATIVHFTGDKLGSLAYPVAPIGEQRSICKHLDNETTRIDALVSKKTRFIELLREKRQALITQAVTKGLNPNVKMKDSGVEWIGTVPEHWKVTHVKYVARLESGHTPSKQIAEYWVDCDIPWVSLGDSSQLRTVDYIFETAQYLNEKGIQGSSAHLLPAGTVVFTRDATVGLAAITGREMAVSQHLIGWVPSDEIESEYLLRVFNSMALWLDSLTAGATIKTIGMDDVRTLATPVPPKNEQKDIVEYVLRCRSKLDQIISKTNRSIELLKERRSALITAAVTGQIDLREAA